MLIKLCPVRGVRNKPACVILVSILSYERVVFNDFQTFYVETAGGSPRRFTRTEPEAPENNSPDR